MMAAATDRQRTDGGEADPWPIDPVKAEAPYHGFPCPAGRCRGPAAIDATGRIEQRDGGAVFEYECDTCGERTTDYNIERRDLPWSKDVLAVDGEACPECEGRLMHPPDDDDHADIRLKCIDCVAFVQFEASCYACGERTTDYARGEDGPVCYDCLDNWQPPDWMPLGGPRTCWDCGRGEDDDVTASKRQTWTTYPQDWGQSRMPRYCDECWRWRREMAPRKPTRDEVHDHRREDNQR